MTSSKKEEVLAALLNAEDQRPKGSCGKGEGSVVLISKSTGMSPSTISRALDGLKAEGRAHIHDWTNANPRAPIWARGPGEDEPKPARLTYEETMKRKRESQRPKRYVPVEERYGGYAKERTLRTIEQVRGTPRPWFAALQDVQQELAA